MINTIQEQSPKALVVATVGRFLNFEKHNVSLLQSLGYEVHSAANFSEERDQIKDIDAIKHQIDFTRFPFTISNVKSFIELGKLLKSENFNLIHCHTPVGGVITRLAANKYRKKGTKVIYTAHGFHFYKGAPLKNWLLYYPIEIICSYMTDTIITINKEDYTLAKKRMCAKRIEYAPGVGIDLKKFGVKLQRERIRTELEIAGDATLILSVGELNENKNHESVIRALSKIPREKVEKLYYVIAGRGKQEEKLRRVIKELGLEKRVFLLGYREDVAALCEAADIYVFPSFREGLSVALMEAMASGLPVICSEIRGNTDLVDEKGGRFFNPFNTNDIAKKINDLIALKPEELREMGKHNIKKVSGFSREAVNAVIKSSYDNYDMRGGAK